MQINSILEEAVHARDIAGAATLTWRPGERAHIASAGYRNLHDRSPVTRDTMFRIASLTKPVTTVAALTMVDEGRFNLDDPITICAPELSRLRVLRHAEGPLDQTDAALRSITFRDLLTHRAGLTYGDFHSGPIGRAYSEYLGPHIDNELTPDQWIARLAELPLIDQPGAGFHYGHSTDLLGFLIARLDLAPLGEVLRRRVLEPLEMHSTSFAVAPADRHRCAAFCGFDADGAPCPLTAAPGGHTIEMRPEAMTFESAGQGLWSTLDDYLAFARMLIDRSDTTSLLRPETRALATSNQLTPDQRATAEMFGQKIFASGHGYGMGVAVVMEPDAADATRGRGGAGTIGWPGAYGSWWQADPTDGSVLLFMTHSMADLQQLAMGIGLGVWGTIARVHRAATAVATES